MKKIENFLKTEKSYSANEIITNQGKNIAWRAFVRQLSASAHCHFALSLSKNLMEKIYSYKKLEDNEKLFIDFISEFSIDECLRKSRFIDVLESIKNG